MDCPLSTWPSITQFDDFSWAGLGDIDPLESLDRNFDNEPGTSFQDLHETKLSAPASTIPCSNTSAQTPHAQNGNLYRLRSSESLVASRWESINAVDLASVLDCTFPSNGDTSTPSAEDVYDLYSDNILNDMDALMSDSMSEDVEGNSTLIPNDTSVNATLAAKVLSMPSPPEDVKCESGATDGNSSGSINISPVDLSNPVVIRGGCNAQGVGIIENGGGYRVNTGQSFPFNPVKPPACRDPSPSSQSLLDLKESMFPPRLDCVQPCMMMQWSKVQPASASHQVFDREKVLRQGTLHVPDIYPAVIDQQVRLADAATAELKRNRAQASRARRLAANQRRAKKYPLQKLIRMSSSPTSTRDRLEQNLAGSAATLHPQLQMVSPRQFTGGVQPLSRGTPNSQGPRLLPVILKSPHMASSHDVLSQANSMQGGPYYSYQQTSLTPAEDYHVSSGSGAMQSMCTDQDVQSLSSTPTQAFSHSTNSTPNLDAVLLEQLQTVLGKMNANVRLCIRDALYRLANSAKHRQSRTDTSSDSSSSHSREGMETNTNSIDRWIVNILFCKQPTSFDSNCQPYPPNLTSAPNHFMENANVNRSSQPWNSCGSSVNLHERPLHVVRGL